MVAVGQTVLVGRVHVAASLGISRLRIMNVAVAKVQKSKYWPMVVIHSHIKHRFNIFTAMLIVMVT